jgi:hypothetical protein
MLRVIRSNETSQISVVPGSKRNKDKINELVRNSKQKNIMKPYRGINDFKRGHQSRSNLVKDKNADLLADSHHILNRLKKFFCQLLNVHRASDVRQAEIHTAEPSISYYIIMYSNS